MGFFKTRVFIAIASFFVGVAFAFPLARRFHLWFPPSASMPPLDPMQESLRQMQRLQEEMMSSMGGAGPAFPRGFSFDEPDLKDEGDHYSFEIDLQGMKPKNFNVQAENGQLTLEGALGADDEDGGISSRFSRSFPIPPDVDTNRIQIENKGDRLVIALPKKK